jgi:hypothetical protein
LLDHMVDQCLDFYHFLILIKKFTEYGFGNLVGTVKYVKFDFWNFAFKVEVNFKDSLIISLLKDHILFYL